MSPTPRPTPRQARGSQNTGKLGFFDDIGKKLTIGAIVGGIIFEVATKSISPWAYALAHAGYDAIACGGRAAMTEGDRLSELAATDAGRAQALFREANTHYEKAFACGFPDAGIRLAGAHCLGLGTEKEPRRALQLLLQIEDKYPDKKMRIETAKKACNLL